MAKSTKVLEDKGHDNLFQKNISDADRSILIKMDEFADLCTSLGRPFYAITQSDSDDPREMFIAQLGPCGCEPKDYNEGTEEERKAYTDKSYFFYKGIINSLTSRPLFLCVVGDYLRGLFYDKHKEESQK